MLVDKPVDVAVDEELGVAVAIQVVQDDLEVCARN